MADSKQPSVSRDFSVAKDLILLAEGDAELAERCEKVIARAGFEVKSAEKVEKKLFPAIAQATKILIVDSDSPPGSLANLLQAMLKQAQDIPVIMLTGSYRTKTEIKGLETGEYDYLAKPFSDDALLAVIRKVAHKTEMSHQSSVGVIAAPQEQKPAPDVSKASEAETDPEVSVNTNPSRDSKDSEAILEKKDRVVVACTLVYACFILIVVSVLPTKILMDYWLVIGGAFLSVPIGRFAARAYLKQKHL